MPLLDKAARHPIRLPDGTEVPTAVYLNQVIDHPRWRVGDYSYASNLAAPADWAHTLAPYLFAFSREKLTIGRFCQFAHGTIFVTSSANHPMAGFSTYPFRVFKPETMAAYLDLPVKDTTVGNDVWTGHGVMVMPGVTIGDGAIIAAGSVVTKDVAPYTIVGGNRAQPIRKRYDDDVIAELLAIRWWDWEVDRIEAALPAIETGDLAALRAG